MTTAAGTYEWVATYNGDTNNAAVSSVCGTEPVTVGKAAPTVSTTPSAGGPVGTSISDTATVSGGHTPTGNVTFDLFAPTSTNCTGTPVFTSTNALNGATPPGATSGTFATTAVGTYHWVAIYNGDANNDTVTSVCGTSRWSSPATPTIATTATPTGGVIGTSVSDTATVTAAPPDRHRHVQPYPPGTDLHRDPGVHLHRHAERSDSARRHLGHVPTTAVGTYHWTATYNGDTNNAAVTSACTAEPVVITSHPGDHDDGHADRRRDRRVHLRHGDGERRATPTATSPSTCSRGRARTAPDPGVQLDRHAERRDAAQATSATFATTAVGTYHWRPPTTATPPTRRSPPPAPPSPWSSPRPPRHRDHGHADQRCDRHVRLGHGDGERRAPRPAASRSTSTHRGPTCTRSPAFTSTDALSGRLRQRHLGRVPTTAVGTEHWKATYNGDTNNTAVTSACTAEPVIITQATPTIATTPSAGGPVGTSISDTATVSGGFIPTGTVTFKLFPRATPPAPAPRSSPPQTTRDRGQRHLRLVPDHQGRHVSLGGHLQR